LTSTEEKVHLLDSNFRILLRHYLVPLLDDLREGVNLALSKKKRISFRMDRMQPVMWIRIRIKLRGRIRIWIRIKMISWIRLLIRIKGSDKLDPDPHPHQFVDEKLNVWN
jgi:hypothetical protein